MTVQCSPAARQCQGRHNTVLSTVIHPLYPAAAHGSDQIFLLNGHNLSSHLFENNSTLFRAQLLNLPGCRVLAGAGDHL